MFGGVFGVFRGVVKDLGRVFGVLLFLNANMRPFMPKFAPLCPLFALRCARGYPFAYSCPLALLGAFLCVVRFLFNLSFNLC